MESRALLSLYSLFYKPTLILEIFIISLGINFSDTFLFISMPCIFSHCQWHHDIHHFNIADTNIVIISIPLTAQYNKHVKKYNTLHLLSLFCIYLRHWLFHCIYFWSGDYTNIPIIVIFTEPIPSLHTSY